MRDQRISVPPYGANRFQHRLGRIWIVLGCVAALVVGTSPASHARPQRPGCTGAIALGYDGHGNRLVPQPPSGPRICVVSTGYATHETKIVVTPDGTVVQEPAEVGGAGITRQQAGVVESADQGATWHFSKPGGSYWVGSNATLYSDPRTGRLFASYFFRADLPPTAGAPSGYSYLLASPDDGVHWSEADLPGFVPLNPRFTSAPPPPGQARPVGGYPDVTYWCGNRVVALVERECWRSLDGGISWEQRSILFTFPVQTQHQECSPNLGGVGMGEDSTDTDANYPQGASDGSLYLMISCQDLVDNATRSLLGAGPKGAVYLARSTDEAVTFPIVSSGQPPRPLVLPVDGRIQPEAGW